MSDARKNTRNVFPATGTKLTAKSWLTEAPMRMLMNNLHPTSPKTPMSWLFMAGSVAQRELGKISIKSLRASKISKRIRHFWYNQASQLASFKPIKTLRAC